jgi:hypothetical protein
LPRTIVLLIGSAAALVTIIGLRQLGWLIGVVFLSLLVKAVIIDADPKAGWAEAMRGPGPQRPRTRFKRPAG